MKKELCEEDFEEFPATIDDTVLQRKKGDGSKVYQVFIMILIYACIFGTSFLYGYVKNLEEAIDILLKERQNRIEQEQRIIEYFENYDDTKEPIWDIPEDNRVL